MSLVRTTIEPDREIEVDDAELLDLQRLGLVAPAPVVTPEGARKAPRNSEKGE